VGPTPAHDVNRARPVRLWRIPLTGGAARLTAVSPPPAGRPGAKDQPWRSVPATRRRCGAPPAARESLALEPRPDGWPDVPASPPRAGYSLAGRLLS
jgi:hypothetical protein